MVFEQLQVSTEHGVATPAWLPSRGTWAPRRNACPRHAAAHTTALNDISNRSQAYRAMRSLLVDGTLAACIARRSASRGPASHNPTSRDSASAEASGALVCWRHGSPLHITRPSQPQQHLLSSTEHVYSADTESAFSSLRSNDGLQLHQGWVPRPERLPVRRKLRLQARWQL
jgi:hypothetical protein